MTLVWRPGFQFDADASTYIEAVEAADEAASPGIGALETGVRYAINDFVIGCKQDGIWSAIKACCILAGARTLNGCLVPLVGTAPTNNGFIGVGADYDRKTGLVGDGSTKYLNSNRNNNADPQNSQHLSIYATADPSLTSSSRFIGGGGSSAGASNLYRANGSGIVGARIRAGSAFVDNAAFTAPSFAGASRSNSTQATARNAGTQTTSSVTSQTPANATISVFQDGGIYSSARLAFYSIGESLDLALLDARVTDLVNAIGAAIP